ncbi:hypothetical protein SGM_5816 [Streptomyces griseoaurantiacus M045]|uniref:Uncharacterized protein n=1 Tax=Streptomyces griseoaurantiacus M045 TaxID=996637 RepID=F3NRQ2_9ACTN|nr:hypothetical protein SGM_5816 [Streptomyces griseoaurantiacus M045]
MPPPKAPRADFLGIKIFCPQPFDRSSIRGLQSSLGHAARPHGVTAPKPTALSCQRPRAHPNPYR